MAYLSNINPAFWICVVALFIGIAESVEKVQEETQRCKTMRGRHSCYDQMYDEEYVVCDGGFEVDLKSDVNWNVLTNMENLHDLRMNNPYPCNTQIPRDIPNGTRVLILSNYRYNRLTRKMLSHMGHVKCLIFQNSDINKIDKDAFGDMTKLNDLEMKNTRLSDYDQLAFITHSDFRAQFVFASGSSVVGGLNFNGTNNLSRIKELRLPANEINYINPSILNHLVNLEYLNLGKNQIADLDWLSLVNLEKWTNLYLDNNRFREISESVVSRRGEVGLANNSWHCNCDMKWLTEASSTHSIMNYEELECTTPVKKRVVDVSPEEFVCAAPHKPTITWRKYSDLEYLIRCASVGDPPPKLALTSADVKIADFPPTPDIEQGNTTSHEILVPPGNYSCAAENSYGISHETKTVPSEQGKDDSSAGNRLNAKLFIFLIVIIACIHL